MVDSNDNNLCLWDFTVKLFHFLGFNEELVYGWPTCRCSYFVFQMFLKWFSLLKNQQGGSVTLLNHLVEIGRDLPIIFKLFFTVVAMIFIIFWDSLMFYQIFSAPEVKRCAIITNIHGIYKLLNDLRLLEKYLNLIER